MAQSAQAEEAGDEQDDDYDADKPD